MTLPHEPKCRPLLKWPGGKRALLPHILSVLPPGFGRYFEPFLGGAALYFALQPARSVLSDIDAGLMNCYVQVQDYPEQVIAHLRRLRNTERDYYRIRAEVPPEKSAQAARLIYLTTLSFNGIHRLNLKGQFNVPYGHKAHVDPCDREHVMQASAALSHADIRCGDFEDVVEEAEGGDLLYCDPPYTVAHSGNGFLKYNSKIFSWDDQMRLAQAARRLWRRGCSVMISNANHPAVLDLYAGFRVQTISRLSVIAASSSYRGVTTECIITNY